MSARAMCKLEKVPHRERSGKHTGILNVFQGLLIDYWRRTPITWRLIGRKPPSGSIPVLPGWTRMFCVPQGLRDVKPVECKTCLGGQEVIDPTPKGGGL